MYIIYFNVKNYAKGSAAKKRTFYINNYSQHIFLVSKFFLVSLQHTLRFLCLEKVRTKFPVWSFAEKTFVKQSMMFGVRNFAQKRS